MTRPRIALVADIPGWAFFNISEQIRRHLGCDYDVSIFFSYEHYECRTEFVSKLFSSRYDIAHFFDRFFLNNLILDIAEAPEQVRDNFLHAKITCSIYDHLLLEPEELERYRKIYRYIADGYTVSSEKLKTIYTDLPGYPPPDMVIEDTVDPALFYPENLSRLKDSDRPFVVGWAGNSRWMEELDGIDHKGLHTVIKPALEQLGNEGAPVVGRFADSSTGRTSLKEMVHYYNSIDVYVCASDIEGTPNPVLEAMACGVPVIATDVGIVPQVFGPLQQKLILEERSVPALKRKIEMLVNLPELRVALSEENQRQMRTWTREGESRKWDSFFRMVLAGQTPETEPGNPQSRKAELMTRADTKRLCLELLRDHPCLELEKTCRHMVNSFSWKVTAPLRRIFGFARHFK